MWKLNLFLKQNTENNFCLHVLIQVYHEQISMHLQFEIKHLYFYNRKNNFKSKIHFFFKTIDITSNLIFIESTSCSSHNRTQTIHNKFLKNQSFGENFNFF